MKVQSAESASRVRNRSTACIIGKFGLYWTLLYCCNHPETFEQPCISKLYSQPTSATCRLLKLHVHTLVLTANGLHEPQRTKERPEPTRCITVRELPNAAPGSMFRGILYELSASVLETSVCRCIGSPCNRTAHPKCPAVPHVLAAECYTSCRSITSLSYFSTSCYNCGWATSQWARRESSSQQLQRSHLPLQPLSSQSNRTKRRMCPHVTAFETL